MSGWSIDLRWIFEQQCCIHLFLDVLVLSIDWPNAKKITMYPSFMFRSKKYQNFSQFFGGRDCGVDELCFKEIELVPPNEALEAISFISRLCRLLMRQKIADELFRKGIASVSVLIPWQHNYLSEYYISIVSIMVICTYSSQQNNTIWNNMISYDYICDSASPLIPIFNQISEL